MFNYTNPKFKKFRDDLNEHFQQQLTYLHDNQGVLYTLDIPYDTLWNLYLESFPNEIKGIYREKAWHNCSACKKWMKKMGNVVSIDEDVNNTYKITSIFDFQTIPEYQMVVDKLNEYIVNHVVVKGVFLNTTNEVGIDENYEESDNGEIITHNHLYTKLPSEYVKSGRDKNKQLAEYQSNYNVLKSSLEKITLQSINTVLDLIRENNLYRGEQWKTTLITFSELKKSYQHISDNTQKELFLWKNIINPMVSKLKNTSIGTLLLDLSKGDDLESALKKYETITAPTNYQRPKPIYTEKMVHDAEEKITQLGYLDSLPRRYANINDLNLYDTLYLDRSINEPLRDVNNGVFDELLKGAVHKPKKFNNVETVTLTEFTDEILPLISSLSVYFDTNLLNNLVSLTTSKNKNTKSMFKWNNNYCWSYKGNLTDTNIKENVKRMGGDTDVDLRFSIQWNDEEWDKNDLDAHCIEPNGNKIYYGEKKSHYTNGWLDIDITDPTKNKVAVENIQFKNRKDLIDGTYTFLVNQYAYRGGDNGFRAEIEVDNNIYSYYYPFRVAQNENIIVAKVDYNKTDDTFTFQDVLNKNLGNITEWNMQLNTFIPVTVVCWSPNYWQDNNVGNKHLFLFLKDCLNPDAINGYYNEYLNNELREHRKVMEALSRKCKADYVNDQLSGLGFSTTIHNEFTIKITINNEEKILKVKI